MEGALHAATMTATRISNSQQEINRHRIPEGRAADSRMPACPPGRHWHWPVVQDSVRVLQLMPQVPQWLALVLVSVSQPSVQLAPSPLQFAKPEPSGRKGGGQARASTQDTRQLPS